MPDVGALYGYWTVVHVDPQTKRATCQCRCGVVRQVSLSALVRGESTGCGCAKPLGTPPKPEQVAKLPDWRPQR